MWGDLLASVQHCDERLSTEIIFCRRISITSTIGESRAGCLLPDWHFSLLLESPTTSSLHTLHASRLSNIGPFLSTQCRREQGRQIWYSHEIYLGTASVWTYVA
ncbi:hypothetical protein XPA_010245 [Xanthoria parietina]